MLLRPAKIASQPFLFAMLDCAAMKIGPDSVIVVTGASRGIGRETAIEFARKGAKVVLASRDETRMAGVALEIQALKKDVFSVTTDVSIESDCHQLIKSTVNHFGRVDVLVNNAGVGLYSSIQNLTTENLEQIFRTNLLGTIWCTQAALPHMKKARRGHIVNVGSVVSKRSIPFMTAYCMTKFAMSAFDEGLRLEVRQSGIDVTLVCPGITETDFQENSGKNEMSPPIHNQGGMSARKVGQAIVSAVENRRRNITLTTSGRFLLILQRISPRLVDELVYFFVVRKHFWKSAEPKSSLL